MSSSSTVRSRKDGSILSEAEAATVLEKAELNGGDDVTKTTATTATAASAASNGEVEVKATKLIPPPPEQPAHIFRRSLIIASFWLVVLCFGLPIWWKTTAIPRANLPLQRMMSWADGKACNPVFPIRIAVEAPGLDEQSAQRLISITQQALDTMPNFPGYRLRLEAIPPTSSADTTPPNTDKSRALVIRLTPSDDATMLGPVSSLHAYAPVLDITYPPNSRPVPETQSSGLATYMAAQLRETFAEEQALMSYFLSTSTIPTDPQSQGSRQDLDASLSKRMTRSMKYAGTYHLTFSLFTSGSSPSSWDIDSAIDQYMRPVLDMLHPIHNFTIDTQVQLYAIPGVQSPVLTKEDLSSFINAAEWPLSPSIGGAPTINFITFMGNQTINFGPEETSQSWLVPQWGSVYLLSPPTASHVPSDFLKQPVLTFASHLLSLLGTPQSGSLPLRLSTLARVRSVDMIMRASSSLGSLARLSLALPSISIPSSVAGGVAESIQHLELACATLGSMESLEHARIAETEAERAFFEKSMVGQLYFPDEHKIAVYLPLLGPVGVPLIMGLLTELKAWKTKRQQTAKAP